MIQLFGYILDHLRGQYHKETDAFQLPDDSSILKALLREAEFYQLPALVSRVNQKIEVSRKHQASLLASISDRGSSLRPVTPCSSSLGEASNR